MNTRGCSETVGVAQAFCRGGVLGVQRRGRGVGAGLPPHAAARLAEEGEAQDEGIPRQKFPAIHRPLLQFSA